MVLVNRPKKQNKANEPELDSDFGIFVNNREGSCNED